MNEEDLRNFLGENLSLEIKDMPYENRKVIRLLLKEFNYNTREFEYDVLAEEYLP